jgi:hypothetical protein
MASIITLETLDRDIPTERVNTVTDKRRTARKSERFLKGPLPLSWVRSHIQCPAGRLLLVLRAHADMRKTLRLKINGDILSDAGIDDRKVSYRALRKLEAKGSITVTRRPGAHPEAQLPSLEP